MTPIAFDTETALIAPGLQAPPIVCMSIAHEDGTELVHHTECRDWALDLLESDRVLIGHNVAFDMSVLAAAWPDLLPLIFEKYERGQVTDTMLRQQLIDIASNSRLQRSYSLAVLSKRWLSRELDKDTWRLRYGELYDVPLTWWPEGAKHYALTDAQVTLEIAFAQENQDRYLEDQFRQARAAWFLQLMRCWGLRTDAEAVRELEDQLQTEHDFCQSGLIQAGLVRENGTRDIKAAARYMRKVCEEKGLAVVLTASGKGVALDSDSCNATGDETLKAYARISALKKRLGTEVELLKRGLIQAWFRPLLETGRTSTNPNIQNVPRSGGIRECYVPRSGKVFAAADYSQFELRTVSQVIVTQLGIPSKLGEALNEGFDPHLEIARRILGITYADAKANKKDPEIDNARQVGKVANFGFPGGLGAKRLVHFARSTYGVEMTEDEARTLKAYWLAAWPEFKAYFEWIGKQTETGTGQIEQAFVRRYRGGCSFCEACNTLFQGLAADAAKRAGFLIAKACYVEEDSPLFGGRPVNFVHDEFIVEVEDDPMVASAAAFELARLMVEGASLFLPDVPPLAEPYLMRRWSKAAGPIFDSAGRLVPWDWEKAA